MRVHTEGMQCPPLYEPRVGNVYPVRGGRGMKDGHLMVVIALTESRPDKWGYDRCGNLALMLIVSKDGAPRGVTQYAISYLDDLVPIAFVDGLESIDLIMRSL